MAEEKMWIAGEWCASSDGATSEALNPANGEVLATVPKATVEDVNRCVDASRAAFESRDWKSMDPAQLGVFSTKWQQLPTPKRKNLQPWNQPITGRPSEKLCPKFDTEHGRSNTLQALQIKSKVVQFRSPVPG